VISMLCMPGVLVVLKATACLYDSDFVIFAENIHKQTNHPLPTKTDLIVRNVVSSCIGDDDYSLGGAVCVFV